MSGKWSFALLCWHRTATWCHLDCTSTMCKDDFLSITQWLMANIKCYALLSWVLKCIYIYIYIYITHSSNVLWFCSSTPGQASLTLINQPTRPLTKWWRGSSASCELTKQDTVARSTPKSQAVWSSVWTVLPDWWNPNRVLVSSSGWLEPFPPTTMGLWKSVIYSNMTVKQVASPYYSFAVYTGKEYVGIVRLHNALESEHQLTRVSPTCMC